jgi:hypothetical protein
VINRKRPVFGALAGLVLIVAAACSGSSATPAANSTLAPGQSAAPAASKTAAVNANDASSLISGALSGASDIKSFHLKLTASGTVKAAALSDATSGAAGGGDLKLDGTSVEGDVDIANAAAHIALNVPPIAALGGIPISADLIVADQVLYLKTALLGGTKYIKMDLASLSSLGSSLPLPSIPVSLPSAGASDGLFGMSDQVASLRKQLDDAGAKATIVGTEKIGGEDATHVNVSVPVDWINQQAAAQASASTTQMKLDSATFDVWIYKANNVLAQLHLTAASSSVGNVDLMLTLTNIDKPVTVKAPAASEVSTSNPFAP